VPAHGFRPVHVVVVRGARVEVPAASPACDACRARRSWNSGSYERRVQAYSKFAARMYFPRCASTRHTEGDFSAPPCYTYTKSNVTLSGPTKREKARVPR